MSRGFSLLEIILSLAILAGSFAALGEVIRNADRHASLSREETQGQIIASSVMDELLSGYRALTAVGPVVYDENMDPPWQYSIEIQNTVYQELLAVRVVVEQQIAAEMQPARFEIVRWIGNPDYMSTQMGSETSSDESDSSTSSSSSSSSSSSGSTSGSSSFGGSSFGGGAGGTP